MDARRKCLDNDNEKCSKARQRARIKWDVEGDENSRFFDSVIRRRNNKTNSRGLILNGGWCGDPREIKGEVFRYF